MGFNCEFEFYDGKVYIDIFNEGMSARVSTSRENAAAPNPRASACDRARSALLMMFIGQCEQCDNDYDMGVIIDEIFGGTNDRED